MPTVQRVRMIGNTGRGRVIQTARPTVRRIARREARRVVKRNTEVKQFTGLLLPADGSVSSTGFNLYATTDYSAGITAPFNITGGSDEGQYIGRKIKPIALKIRYNFTYADANNTVSIMVIQARGAFTASTISAANQYQYGGTTYAPLSPLNEDFNERYKVLARHVVDVTDVYSPTKSGVITIKGRKLRQIVFADASGTVESNPIFISVISDSSAATHPNMRIVWRLYYTDS